MQTPLCRRLDIQLPIIQAPIGSASCPALAAAVSNAGGLGMLALSWHDLDHCRRSIRETRRLTPRPFGVNLVLEWDQRDRLAVALDEGVTIVSTTWGDPAPLVESVRRAGATLLHSVGSSLEARAARTAGVDAIVAQGWEAGGHVRGEVATSVLVPAVIDAVGDLPVIAAGGIADGRGIAAALALGAQAAWLGTRFVCSVEARAHPSYQGRVVAARETDTEFTTLFDGGWPNAPHRVLRNATVIGWVAAGRPQPPNRPGEGDPIAWTSKGDPILRYSDTIPTPGLTGEVDGLALYAGQSAALIDRVLPAGELVARLATETAAALDRLARLR